MGANSSIRRNYTHWRLSRKRGNSKLKRATFCPICNLEFKSWQTYDDFNYHIDNCLAGNDPSLSAKDDKQFSKLTSTEEKLEWIREQFNSIRIHWSDDHKKILVSRESILEDSLKAVQHLSDFEMRCEFQIQFKGENAMDAGGLMKEWINLLIKILFSEEMGLFTRTKTDQVSYILTSNDSNSELYYFTGKLLAKAIYENIPVNCPLCNTVFKHLLDLRVGLKDIECQDSDLYNSLLSLSSQTIDDAFIGYFALEKGSNLYELKKNGSEILITDENKAEYLELRSLFETFYSMQPGLTHLKNGFFSVFPCTMIAELMPEELESLLCGKAELNLAEWKENTEYKGEFSPSHKVVKWFWEVLKKLSKDDLTQLLVFVTGTNRVPIDGFRNLKTLRGEPALFTLQSIESGKKPLPQAHTCFNRLELPIYKKKKELKQSLKFVIKNHCLGFGLE
jgi:hypothetical protein